ncbi:unannotated protein [freshwater metagenome]|uniref:Unannotated protein n=1 Tax=freshwater metagenome TaxID=449393 RepID=A0A6J5ZAX3_9ZZZZ|nr:hypothetical protein [Actinomycetota bacterium]
MQIIPKLRDSLTMFWQALDDAERRVLLLAFSYVVAGTVASAAKKNRARQIHRMKNDILEELRHGR